MNICIAGTFSYPDGCGASARMYCYAEGFRRNGAKVIVIPFEGDKGDFENTFSNEKPIESRIKVYYQRAGINNISRTNGFIIEKIALFKEIRRFNKQIKELHNIEPITALILVGRSLIILLPIIRHCKRMGIKVIHEKSEYPFVTDKKTPVRLLYYEMYNRTVYRMFDGILVISTMLKEYFNERMGEESRVLRVPILVDDTQEDITTVVNPTHLRTILYVGNLEHEEEIVILLNSFGIISKEYPDWILSIVGETTSKRRNSYYKAITKSMMIKSKVIFHGRLSRKKIPLMLADADIMTLPRASGQFSSAGFPTKLGEYLLSGKPVVVSATGDIPNYLTNEVDSYLVKPGDQSMFTQTLIQIIDNYRESEVVGKRGRETALREFSCIKHSARIMKFIQKL